MKISLNWLKDFIDISDVPTDEVVHKLTMCGLEVESVINQKEIFKNFVVGFVKEKQKHPKADKLSLCKVSIGSEELQVVCGAPNVEAGQKVIVALIGAIIPSNGMLITKAKIRGIESFGMICSDSELQISDDHSGIKVLDQNLVEGTPISEALGFDDVILEIGITPNRPDALSHIGVARDLAALYNRELKTAKINLQSSSKNISGYASVEVIDAVNCPRYSAKVVLNVNVKESPAWLKKKIESIGLRSINNIVDVTNYINFELGQPLHAFDLDKLNGKKIIVKRAEKDSTFITLDSKERKLNQDVLLICDSARPVAIAGVMGGENSEVTLQTKNLLIESAYFNSKSIRKTSKFLGLNTDSSYRFERGTNPDGTVYAAEKAALLISELSGGEVVNGVIDIYPNKIKQYEVTLRLERIEKILGYKIEKKKIAQILKSLGFDIIKETPENISVKVPLFRPDIEREIDLIEEVARIDGYENIPTVLKTSITLQEKVDESQFVDEIKNLLVSCGYNEIYSNSLVDETSAKLFGEPVHLQNPLGMEMSCLRTSLIPGGLDTIKKNINAGEKNLKIFEIGKVFTQKSKNITSFDDFTEEQKLLVLITGKAMEKQWYGHERDYDFFDLKGVINFIVNKKSLANSLSDSYYNNGNYLFDYYTAKNYNNSSLVEGGKIKKEILKQFDIKQDVFCFELNIDEFKKIDTSQVKFKELLRFPKIHRDFAFVVDKAVTFEEVKSFIRKKASGLLKNVTVFDIFESESLGLNKKSLAFSLEYFDYEKTLTEEEVEKDFSNLIYEIKKEFNAILRGN